MSPAEIVFLERTDLDIRMHEWHQHIRAIIAAQHLERADPDQARRLHIDEQVEFRRATREFVCPIDVVVIAQIPARRRQRGGFDALDAGRVMRLRQCERARG